MPQKRSKNPECRKPRVVLNAPTRRQRRLYCCLAVLRWVATDFWLASVLQAASLSALKFGQTRLISGYIDCCAIAGVVQRFAVAALAIASRSSHE